MLDEITTAKRWLHGHNAYLSVGRYTCKVKQFWYKGIDGYADADFPHCLFSSPVCPSVGKIKINPALFQNVAIHIRLV